LRRAAAAIAAALALAAGGPAAAYERTRGDQCGACIYWAPLVPSSGSPWELRMSVAGAPRAPSCAGDAGLAAIGASLATWSDVACSHLRIALDGTTGDARVGLDGRNVVVFRHGPPCDQTVPATDPCWDDLSCGNRHGCWDGSPMALATTLVTHHPTSGFIYDADVELNDWGGAAGPLPPPTGQGGASGAPSDGWYFTCLPAPGGAAAPPVCASYGETGCAYYDLQNTLTHEVGHVVGLAHPPGPDTATMWEFANVAEISKRDLDPDDVAGLCAIYPAGAEPTTCAGTGGPGCAPAGCACGSGGGGAMAIAALVLARLARRRPGRAAARGQRTITPA
jgi:uncharacterized protein (TIGR03382 family)